MHNPKALACPLHHATYPESKQICLKSAIPANSQPLAEPAYNSSSFSLSIGYKMQQGL